ncbi:MAG TPA: serine hydrolase domain-containing protein [Povalibacter sp.]|nr:serine hydrolase domain-containing protein [Povalibacter sp.]
MSNPLLRTGRDSAARRSGPGLCARAFITLTVLVLSAARAGSEMSSAALTRPDRGDWASVQTWRFEHQVPAPRSRQTLQRYLNDIRSGAPEYSQVDAEHAEWLQIQPQMRAGIAMLGEIRSIRFMAVAPIHDEELYVQQRCAVSCPDPVVSHAAADIYHVLTDTTLTEWRIALDPAGKVDWAVYRRLEMPPSHPLTRQQFTTALGQRLQADVAADRFAGAVAITRNGRTLLEFSGGEADRAQHIANRVTTKFRNGSIDKMFTAVAILQLVQAGAIDLNAPLATYVPDYPNPNVARNITIHQLLTHTAGTGSIFGPRFFDHLKEFRTLEDYVRVFGDRELLFPPGSRFDYSNFGYILLGVVVERVSGQSYYQYVDEHVFRPAGMTDTGFVPEDVQVPGRAVGYTRPMRPDGPGALQRADDFLEYRGTSAGGGYTTVADLQRFAHSLLSCKLLSPAATRLLLTPKVRIGVEQYAYGFYIGQQNGQLWIGHGGGGPGQNGQLRIFPQSGYVIAALANLDAPAADAVTDFAAVRLPAP